EGGGIIDLFTGAVGPSAVPPGHFFSPSQVEAFGQCAYKWFGQAILRFGDPEEAEDDLAASIKGNLYHATLSRAVNAGRNAPDLRLAVLESLEQDFDATLAEIPGSLRLAGWPARR